VSAALLVGFLAHAAFGAYGPGWTALVLAVLVPFVNTATGLYKRDELLISSRTLDEAPTVFQAATLSAVLAYLIESGLISTPLGAQLVALSVLGLTVLTVFARATARGVVRRLTAPERCLVVGGPDAERRLREQLRTGAEAHLAAARADLEQAPNAAALQDELAAARDDVCRFAQGIHPRTLTEYGLAAALAELVAPLRDPSAWRPSLARADDGYSAFAPYELRHAGPIERVARLSQAVQRYYGSRATRSTADQARAQLKRELEGRREREQHRLDALERELAQSERADRLRRAGELLLAYASALPHGADRVELHGQEIELEPSLSPVENAQRYFERYTRARDAARRLPDLIAPARALVDYLTEALVYADLADDPDAVAALRRELSAVDAPRTEVARPAGHRTRPERPGQARSAARPAAAAAPAPLRVRLGEHTLLVGRSGRQNDEVTFRLASPDDLWLHARGVPGAHVILRAGPGRPDDATVRRAAEIAAYHSASRGAGAVAVDVTERRHVRKIKGGPPGAVTYSGERTLQVRPAPFGRVEG
jgi:hypothetical protein